MKKIFVFKTISLNFVFKYNNNNKIYWMNRSKTQLNRNIAKRCDVCH